MPNKLESLFLGDNRDIVNYFSGKAMSTLLLL